MLFKATNKRRGYSLIELMVVLAIVVLIGVAGLPNLAGNNDRANLIQAANEIKESLIDARTRSLAPTKNDGSATAQVYQVAFGKFSSTGGSTDMQLPGTALSNTISLEKGLGQCDSSDLSSGFNELNSYKLPRGVYISNFYPSNKTVSDTDTQAVVRFSVGQVGFSCGKYTDPAIQSTDFYSGYWNGTRSDARAAIARYLLVELSVSKLSDKRYVVVDRKTGEVSVASSNPQSYFTPTGDTLAPKWSALEPFLLSITCGPNSSTVTISYPKATDRTVDPNSVDSSQPVYYDLSWDLGTGTFVPIAVHYFYDLSNSIVVYTFTTTAFSTVSQPKTITVRSVASDQWGNVQPQANADSTLKWLQKSFTPSCGSINVTVNPAQPTQDSGVEQNAGGNSTAVQAQQATQIGVQ